MAAGSPHEARSTQSALPDYRGRFERWHTDHPLGAALATAYGLAAVSVLALVALPLRPGDCDIVDIELVGSNAALDQVLSACSANSGDVIAAVLWDYLFIAIYAVALFGICFIGARRLWAGNVSALALAGAWSAVAAAGLDVVENGALLVGLYLWPEGPDAVLALAQGAALAKFVALLLPLIVATGVLVALARRWFSQKDLDVVTVPRSMKGPETGADAWRLNYAVPQDQAAADGGVGICLSGGGIRSGTFAMGALNALAAARDPAGYRRGLLDEASYLSTVSGGGYFGGAMQMLRHRSAAAGTPISIDEAFSPGSPEVDHVRRHSKYVAEGPGQWLIAVMTLLRNVAFGLGIGLGVLMIAASGLALWYQLTAQWSEAAFGDALQPTAELGSTAPGTGALIAAGLPLLLALLLWLTTNLGDISNRHLRLRMASVALALSAAVAAVVLVLPLLVTWLAEITTVDTGDGTIVRLGSIAALAATATTIWNAVGKRLTSKGTEQLGRVRKALHKAAFATRFLTTVLVVAAILALAAVVFLAALTGALSSLFVDDDWGGLIPAGVAAALILVALVVFDQTRMSLHPFYKKRLATAFAVERRDGSAAQIDYDDVTSISQYGRPISATGKTSDQGLQLIVCAAAHVSGNSMGAPGRRVVPFTFSSDGIGSPRLGYLSPTDLEQRTERTSYRVDLTQMAATALSGAAFASSMGRHSGPFDTILTLTNARLGAWLPNPRYHRRRNDRLTPVLEDRRAAFPRTRRLQYFFKEIVGNYSPDDRFVYVTDGGHYENLGLVELLRRRCTTIYCIDASGDASLAQTLAQAASLAHEELGVRISISGIDLAVTSSSADDADDTDPGAAEGLLEMLEERLAGTDVAEGTITYPPATTGSTKRLSGRLIVGKSRLTDTLDPKNDFAVLTYAVTHPEFPNDSTADQWFDAEQFQAYLSLGQIVGTHMADLAASSSSPAPTPTPGPASSSTTDPGPTPPGLLELRLRWRRAGRRPNP